MRLYRFVLLNFMMAVLSGCGLFQSATDEPTDRISTAGASNDKITKRIDKGFVRYDYFSADARVYFEDSTASISVSTNIMATYDSVIEISVRKMIMVARLQITPEKCRIVDYHNRCYREITFEQLRERLNMESLTFGDLQDMLVGNPYKPLTAYRMTRDNGGVYMRRSFNMLQETLIFSPSLFRVTHYLLERAQIGPLAEVTYSEFKTVSNRRLAHRIELKAQHNGQVTTTVKINYDDVVFDEAPEYRFSVPESYRARSCD